MMAKGFRTQLSESSQTLENMNFMASQTISPGKAKIMERREKSRKLILISGILEAFQILRKRD